MSEMICGIVVLIALMVLVGFTNWLKVRHIHKWTVTQRNPILSEFSKGAIVGEVVTLQCKSCGDIRSKRIGP